MTQAFRHAGIKGPPLVRLLARLAQAAPAAPGVPLPDQLGAWLGWTDAIALSAALNGDPPVVPGAARAAPGDELARLRQRLAQAIADERPYAAARRSVPAQAAVPEDPAETAADYAPYRRHYVALQEQMERAIGSLRGQWRLALAAAGGQAARLAMLDAVMERVLGARERAALAGVPALLERRFRQLRQDGPQAARQVPAGAAAAPGAELDVFAQEMRGVLLAELDVRLQPLQGLDAALRASNP
ncbi:DUF3348 family protein [Orrella sp. JC864]|uniref:DUF3348 family protein n=1 Tax=Orrella sp. JC864 TaxID=3120298 RepID=UPI0012BB7026